MPEGRLYFADGAGPLCPRVARRAQRIQLGAVEAGRVNVHDGIACARVEQGRGGFAVDLAVENYQTLRSVEGNDEGFMLLRECQRAQKNGASCGAN